MSEKFFLFLRAFILMVVFGASWGGFIFGTACRSARLEGDVSKTHKYGFRFLICVLVIGICFAVASWINIP